jgi:hypothetical protein
MNHNLVKMLQDAAPEDRFKIAIGAGVSNQWAEIRAAGGEALILEVGRYLAAETPESKAKLDAELVERLKTETGDTRIHTAASAAKAGKWAEIHKAGGSELVREAAVFLENNPDFQASPMAWRPRGFTPAKPAPKAPKAATPAPAAPAAPAAGKVDEDRFQYLKKTIDPTGKIESDEVSGQKKFMDRMRDIKETKVKSTLENEYREMIRRKYFV